MCLPCGWLQNVTVNEQSTNSFAGSISKRKRVLVDNIHMLWQIVEYYLLAFFMMSSTLEYGTK